MNLLPLNAEVIRLRRMAKACQAGELSRSEYRQTRREVISGFVSRAGVTFDDTVPRFDAEVTQRRMPAELPVTRKSSASSLFWLGLAAIVVVGLTLPLWAVF